MVVHDFIVSGECTLTNVCHTHVITHESIDAAVMCFEMHHPHDDAINCDYIQDGASFYPEPTPLPDL